MTSPPKRSAVFLDRDGTLIEDRGHLRSPSEVVFFPDTVCALRLLQRNFRLFIVTNQPGIAEGTVEAAEVAQVNDHVVKCLSRAGIRIERVYCCPHRRSDNCACIKPNNYYLCMAAREFGIDLAKSFVVGDHPHDVELARNSGATGIYVLTGHGVRHRESLPADTVVTSGIGEAATLILERSGCGKPRQKPSAETKKAAAILRRGGVVAFPTETVYGLGANAFDAAAVARIFEIKGRPRFDPLIVHVGNLQQAKSLVADFPLKARELARRFWPGPLTLVLPKTERVPDIVTAGLPTVAIRMPDHPLALALIREAGTPLAAPSANRFGRISPTTAEHVRRQLGRDVDLVLDGGPCRVGVESTVLSLVEEEPSLLRAGGVAVEDIEAVVGPVLRPHADPDCFTAPGQCPQHYAPDTPLILRERFDDPPETVRAGLLAFRAPTDQGAFTAVEVLSPAGDLQEAARNLFAALYKLDAMNLDVIVVERVPPRGLGLAINDRLGRASYRTPGAGMTKETT
ncbi:MAG TPA: L-threonylcarbamoyladenylate synthase [Sedimentisphaerales bacterium]|nr:L-threonylcarbamoyladenylate synthase [Sedimentisphaerales bacterium]